MQVLFFFSAKTKPWKRFPSGIDFCRAKTGFQSEPCVRIQHVRSPPPDNGKWSGWRSRVFDIPQIKTTSDEVCHWKKRGATPILMWRVRLRLTTRMSSTQIFGALQTRTQWCSYLFWPSARSRPAGKSMNSAPATRSLFTFIIIDPAIATARDQILLRDDPTDPKTVPRSICCADSQFRQRRELIYQKRLLRGWKWWFTRFYAILGGILKLIKIINII